MGKTYYLSKRARRDLLAIERHSRDHWGEQQAYHYLESFARACRHIAGYPQVGRPRDDVMPGIRSITEGAHVIFYRVHHEEVEVIGVLHQRQDPQNLTHPDQ